MASLTRNRYGNFGSTSTLSNNDHTGHGQGGSLGGVFPSGGGSSWKNAGAIWGSSAIGSGLKNGTSESIRSQDDTSSLSADTEVVTGSRSLLASSDADDWDRQPNKPWMEASTPGTRSSQNSQSENSPTRHHHSSQITPLQPLSQNVSASSSYFSMSNAVAASQGMKRAQDNFPDPLTGTFASEAFYGSFRNNQSSRHNSNEENRPPSISFHIGPADSPRQSHFQQNGLKNNSSGRLSSSNSRSGSLPPSRNVLQLGRFEEHQPAKTNAQSGSYQTHGSLHRPNLSANASVFQSSNDTLNSIGGGVAGPTQGLENLGIQFGGMHVDRSGQRGPQQSSYQMSNDQASGPGHRVGNSLASETWLQDHEGGSLNLGGITPDSMSMATMQQLQQYRNSAFSGSSASATTNDQRRGQHSPFYATSETPPLGQQHRLPSRDSLSNASNSEAVLLDRKLHGFHQEQPVYPGPPHLPFRGGYAPPYSYQVQSPLRMNPLAAYYSMPSAPHMINHHHVPRGPAREHDVGSHLRSPLLEEFRSNSKTNKRYELKDIYNHIVEFSGDQHGSRFIQQKLETANSDEKDQVFREIQPNAIQLMTDVFGNYVIQKFFEHGNQPQKKVLANQMKNRVLSLSRQMYGCRVVQKALEHILTDQQASLVKELESSVMICVKDQNGNHVIQKAIERVPAEHIQFIVNAFTGQIQTLSIHPYGCRVIQRMLEHCVEPTRSMVLQELHVCAASLIVDQYGNYVTQHIIEHGREEDRNKVISLVTAQLLHFSKHKFASNVVEKCVQFSTYEQRQVIVNALTGTNEKGESTLQHLIQDQYGNYVIQKTLAQLKGEEYTEFVNQIKTHVAILKQFRYNKQITAIEKMVYSSTPPAPTIHTPHANPPVDTFAAPTPPLVPSDGPSPQSASFPSTQTGSVGEPVDSRKSSTSNDVVVLTPTST